MARSSPAATGFVAKPDNGSAVMAHATAPSVHAKRRPFIRKLYPYEAPLPVNRWRSLRFFALAQRPVEGMTDRLSARFG
jgi:hypothetical protein